MPDLPRKRSAEEARQAALVNIAEEAVPAMEAPAYARIMLATTFDEDDPAYLSLLSHQPRGDYEKLTREGLEERLRRSETANYWLSRAPLATPAEPTIPPEAERYLIRAPLHPEEQSDTNRPIVSIGSPVTELTELVRIKDLPLIFEANR